MNIISKQGDTLDQICWRIFGRTAGVTEAAYEMNRALAAFGPVIPEGTAISLPDGLATTPIVRKIVQLWD